MNPAEIQANLNMFMADQKAEQNANKILFLSPEEREKMEKAKMKVKQERILKISCCWGSRVSADDKS